MDPSGHKYDASSAVTYAKKWALYRNSKYKSHSSDCTNFVSQCFEAGGMKQNRPDNIDGRKNISDTTNYWYSKRYRRDSSARKRYYWKESTSWINVADFKSYWGKHGADIMNNKTLTYVQNNCKNGDVVQLKIDGTWQHSIIITGGTKGNKEYCCHSKDYWKEPLSRYKGRGYKYRIIRVH